MKPGLYRHYKGGLYAVLGVVRDSTNGPNEGTEMVLYYSLGKRALHVRDAAQFAELAPQTFPPRPRFELLAPDPEGA